MSRRSIYLFSILGILLLSFAAPGQKRTSKRMHGAAKPLPLVAEIDTANLLRLLKRQSSKPLLVNFWATWCDPCRDEFPDLVKIHADYRDNGLDFIIVSLDDLKDINTEVPKFLKLMKAEMPAYLLNVDDPTEAITAVDARWSGALPATFLYDRSGNVSYKHLGRVNPKELRSAIDQQLQKDPVRYKHATPPE